VRVLAASARGKGARVFIALLTPTKGGRRSIPLGIVQAANDRLRQVARNEGAIVIDTFTPLLADLDGNIDTDGLHLTPLGYRRLGEVVFAAIRAELEVR
jgi:lysophospholipase L1-like esterase